MDAIYSRLPVEKDKFRVLRIKEARHSDDGPGLSFSLKLNDNADDNVRDVYAAISYTWGGQPFDHIIKVDDVDYAVTRSCAQALEEVHKCGYTFVWIDQVCINQTDLGERGAQISLMSRIYAAAAEVVIWLGPFNELTFTPTYLEQSEMLYVDPEQSADSYHVLQQAGTTVRTVGTAEDKLALEVVALIREVGLAFKRGALQQSRVGGKATAAAWERALGIVTSRYFGRRWINQEVVHNDIVSIRLGSQMIDYSELDCFVHGLLDGRSVLFDTDIEKMLEDRDVGSLTGLWRITGTANMRHRMRRQLKQDKTDRNFPRHSNIDIDAGVPATEQLPSLVWLLAIGSLFETTLTHDRIFALSAMCKERDHLPFPDYSVSYATVALDYAVRLIELGDGPGVLLFAGLDCNPDFGAPSWCPSWELSVSPLNAADFIRREGRQDTKYMTAARNTKPQMTVSEDCTRLTVRGSMVGKIQATHLLGKASDGMNWFWDVWRFVQQYSSRPGSSVSDLEGILQDLRKMKNGLSRSERLNLRVTRRSVEIGLRSLLCNAEDVAALEAEARMEDFPCPFFPDDGNDLCAHILCVTEAGYIGLVPSTSQVGDYVAVLHGVDSTKIIRSQGDGNLLVGDSYFLDLSKGEVFEQQFYKPEDIVLV